VTVAVVVDSTADIPAALRDEYNITVVPLTVLFGNETFLDGVEMTGDQFYKRLVEGSVHPKTSQPAPGQFVEAFERLARDHDGIVSIHLSGKLSGTVQSARQAAELVPDVPIRVIDSGSVSMGFGYLAIEAARMAQNGESLDQIADKIEAMAQRAYVWAALDTLRYLERGGRIGGARAFLGTLLSVKPIIQIKGEVLPSEQVRTHKKAMTRLVDLANAQAPYSHVAVMYSTSRQYADEIVGQLGSLAPREQIVVAQLTPVLGVYGGPDLVGIAGIKKG
jgi:DegV family protein with EDD domain